MQVQVADGEGSARLDKVNVGSRVSPCLDDRHYARADNFDFAALGDDYAGIFFQPQAQAPGIGGDNLGHADDAPALDKMGVDGYVVQKLQAGSDVNFVFVHAPIVAALINHGRAHDHRASRGAGNHNSLLRMALLEEAQPLCATQQGREGS